MPGTTPHAVEHVSIHTSFADLTRRDPNATAVVDAETGAITTRRDLLDLGESVLARLHAAGVGPGHLTGVQLPNSVGFLATILAVLRGGMTAVAIDRDAQPRELGTILDHLGARALVSRSPKGGAMPEVALRGGEATIGEERVALLKLTSGSTGLPKGILTTERNLIADCTSICVTMDIRSGDVSLGAIPFSHSYGFSNLLMPLFVQGTAVVATNQYLPLSILDLANRFGCTVIPGIPMMFDHLAQLALDDGRLETVRTLISAGAPLRADVSRRFRERFGLDIHSFYGCSECGGIAYDRVGGSVERGTVGTAMEGVDLTIEPDGRLIAASRAVALGYYRGEESENAKFACGSYRTDDLARLTESGEIELIGRAGDLINTAGKKVNPREIEQVILQLQGVREVKVWGEAAGARGEVVAAAVVAQPEVTTLVIRKHCKLHLSSWKIPRIVKLIERMPLDERGKLKREELRRL